MKPSAGSLSEEVRGELLSRHGSHGRSIPATGDALDSKTASSRCLAGRKAPSLLTPHQAADESSRDRHQSRLDSSIRRSSRLGRLTRTYHPYPWVSADARRWQHRLSQAPRPRPQSLSRSTYFWRPGLSVLSSPTREHPPDSPSCHLLALIQASSLRRCSIQHCAFPAWNSRSVSIKSGERLSSALASAACHCRQSCFPTLSWGVGVRCSSARPLDTWFPGGFDVLTPVWPLGNTGRGPIVLARVGRRIRPLANARSRGGIVPVSFSPFLGPSLRSRPLGVFKASRDTIGRAQIPRAMLFLTAPELPCCRPLLGLGE